MENSMTKKRVKQKSLFDDILIKVGKNFSRSTSLKMDFQDKSSLKHLIVSEKFQKNFNSICPSFIDNNSNQRVHVISGTPGVGKSTFAVFLARCLSKGNKGKLTTIVEQQEKMLSAKFTKNYKQITKENYLPIFLNGDEGEIEDAFYEALKVAFTEHDLSQDFEGLAQKNSNNAFGVITNWKKNYPLKFEEFKKFVDSNYDEGYEKFQKSLKRNRRNAQKFFFKAYKQITGGASIASYRHGQVIDLYKNAAILLNKKKFSGIFIAYDEFGKYLERGVRHPNDFDLQFLQDMAELCNKGQESHIHLLLITHLPISQYATQLPASIQQEWTKIEGRFQQSSFNSSYESSYTILGSVFESNIKADNPSAWKKISALSKKWVDVNSSTRNFPDVFNTKYVEEIISESFPLHPSAFCLLPLLSEKVAQNERTMFSFLTRDEDSSLPRFLKNSFLSTDQLNYIGPFDLYSYFKQLIENDMAIGGAYKIGLIVNEVLNSLDSSQKCEKDVISLLGIATIINNRSIFRITSESIQTTLSGLYKSDEVDKSIKTLEKSKSIIYDHTKSEYVLFEGSSIDIGEEINKARQTRLTTAGYINILKKNFNLNFIVPKKYNFKNGITRYFREEVISIEELMAKKIATDYSKEDGKVYYVIPFTNSDMTAIKNHLETLNLKSSVFVLTNKPLEIERELLELHAIEAVYSKKEILSSGPKVKKELDHHRDTAKEIIKKSLKKARSNVNMDVTVNYKGKVLSSRVNQILDISNFVSDICEEEYHSYPVFYNEMINKAKASTPIIQGRIRLISAFDKCHLNRYGIEGGGPDFSLYKSLLKSNSFSFDTNNDGTKTINGLKKNSTLIPLFEDFLAFLKESEQTTISMETLIERWRKPPFGIRVPLIPLYMNLFSRMTSSPISYFHDDVFVGKLDIELFENLIKQPKKYSLRMLHLDKKRMDFLKRIGNAFAKNIPYKFNTDNLDFLKTAKIISTYYSLIPSFTRRCPALTRQQKKLIAQLEVFKQPEEFILFDLPNVYTGKASGELTSSEINNFISSLESDLNEVFKIYVDLVGQLAGLQKEHLLKLQEITGKQAFPTIKKGAPLAKYWKNALLMLSDKTLSFPYSDKTLMFVNRINQLNDKANNQSIVETLADSLTGANPKSWSEKGLSLFEHNIRSAISEIKQIHYLNLNSGEGVTTISSFDESGKPSFKEILKSNSQTKKLSSIINSIRTNIENLEDIEKNTVLLELLNEINNKKNQPTKVTNKSTIGAAWG